MVKLSFDKQIEKQIKRQTDKFIKEQKRQAREQEKNDRKERIRETAKTIVNGQPVISDFKIMDQTAEIVLQCLLKQEIGEDKKVCFCDDIFPDYLQMGIGVELEKLVQYGIISGLFCFDNGGMLYLLPTAYTYFENKEAAYLRQKEAQDNMSQEFFYNTGNIVFGNVTDATLSVDNSITELAKAIDEYGGEDKEILHDLLEEVKDLIETIESSKQIPKQRKLHEKLTDHMAKHGWFYGAVLQLLGTAAMNVLGGI